MFDISIWELLVIAVVALIFIGPKHIPQVAFKIGSWVAYARNMLAALSAEMRQQMQQEIMKKQSSDVDKVQTKDDG